MSALEPHAQPQQLYAMHPRHFSPVEQGLRQAGIPTVEIGYGNLLTQRGLDREARHEESLIAIDEAERMAESTLIAHEVIAELGHGWHSAHKLERQLR